ncbi:cation diffusion facilitator family transporter [Candidatus Woesearchaeota archaeon]|nr:cation diffusion facilitator family transporter [Candidatus Woesearchaeota archaeon]
MKERNATLLGITGNVLLFAGKLIVGLAYNSIAIISDALNSFTDIIASFIVHHSVAVSYKRPDKEHQFGHKRAQPVAALIVAIFMGILGFEVIAASARRLISAEDVRQGIIPVYLLLLVMGIKLFLYLYTKKVCSKSESTALKAELIDHRNDILISFAVLVGFIFSGFGYAAFDPAAAAIVGIYIIKSGYDIGRDNIKFLMGEAPADDMFRRIQKKAESVDGVIGINDLHAHYVGTKIEAEVHIYLDKKMDVKKSHDIGKNVKKKIEKMNEVDKVFVHIDPFEGKLRKERKF